MCSDKILINMNNFYTDNNDDLDEFGDDDLNRFDDEDKVNQLLGGLGSSELIQFSDVAGNNLFMNKRCEIECLKDGQLRARVIRLSVQEEIVATATFKFEGTSLTIVFDMTNNSIYCQEELALFINLVNVYKEAESLAQNTAADLDNWANEDPRMPFGQTTYSHEPPADPYQEFKDEHNELHDKLMRRISENIKSDDPPKDIFDDERW